MISRRQKMVNLWKQVRFIEIVDPGNQFVKNLMFDGVYSSDFALLSEDILDWFSAINERYASVYSDTEHHRAVKADHRSNVCLIETVRMETKAILPDRLCFSVYCVGKSLQKRHSPRPNAVPSPLPLFTGAMRHGTNAKGWTGHVRGLFSVKKPPVSSIQAAFWLHTAAATASAPARAASAQGFGRHWPDRAHLERLRPVFQVCGRKQPFGVCTSAIGARRTGFIGADHVFKLARAGRAIKIVHRHKGITPF